MRYRIDTERVDLFDVSIVITMCVSLEKIPSFDVLEKAFFKACGLHEVLQSKVVIEEGGEAFYVDSETHNNSITETSLGLEELITENEKIRFRIDEGDFIRAFVSPDGIVFMMHHLGGDGKSLVYFIETFMNCLAGIECEFRPFRNITSEDLPAGNKMPFVYKILCDSWNSKWNKVKKIFGFSDMDRAYEQFWQAHRSSVEIKEYNKDELDQMTGLAKKAGVSLTAYIVCDMIKEMKFKADIGFAADGRTDKNRSMGNQATGISIQYRYDPKKTFDDNARAIYKLMQKKLSDDRFRFFVLQFMSALDPTLKDALNLEHTGTFNSKISSTVAGYLGYGDKVKDLSVTNLTRADIPDVYGEYKISKIAFIPPVVSYAKNVIGIVTIGDIMVVTRHILERSDKGEG